MQWARRELKIDLIFPREGNEMLETKAEEWPSLHFCWPFSAGEDSVQTLVCWGPWQWSMSRVMVWPFTGVLWQGDGIGPRIHVFSPGQSPYIEAVSKWWVLKLYARLWLLPELGWECEWECTENLEKGPSAQLWEKNRMLKLKLWWWGGWGDMGVQAWM